MKRTSVSLLLFALLGGCASGMGGESWVFEKPDMTQAQLKLDRDGCFGEAVDPLGNNPGITMQVNRDAYNACMERRGYRVRRTTTVAAVSLEEASR